MQFLKQQVDGSGSEVNKIVEVVEPWTSKNFSLDFQVLKQMELLMPPVSEKAPWLIEVKPL